MLSADKNGHLRWKNKEMKAKRSEMDGAEEFA